jgi:hypothetical protein
MITGIAETMAITMMVTAKSLAIASRLCPPLTPVVQFLSFRRKLVAHLDAVLTFRELKNNRNL